MSQSSHTQSTQSNESNRNETETSETRPLLTVEQAAGFLQLSASSIRTYIRQGRLKAFRIAGLRKVLIPREQLLDLLEPISAPHTTDDQTASL